MSAALGLQDIHTNYTTCYTQSMMKYARPTIILLVSTTILLYLYSSILSFLLHLFFSLWLLYMLRTHLCYLLIVLLFVFLLCEINVFFLFFLNLFIGVSKYIVTIFNALFLPGWTPQVISLATWKFSSLSVFVDIKLMKLH